MALAPTFLARAAAAVGDFTVGFAAAVFFAAGFVVFFRPTGVFLPLGVCGDLGVDTVLAGALLEPALGVAGLGVAGFTAADFGVAGLGDLALDLILATGSSVSFAAFLFTAF